MPATPPALAFIVEVDARSEGTHLSGTTSALASLVEVDARPTSASVRLAFTVEDGSRSDTTSALALLEGAP